MGLTRRTTLVALLGSGFLARAQAAPLPPAMVDGTGMQAAVLDAFSDTLIPADEFTPAASALGLGAMTLAAARGKPYARLIEQGCAWLDSRADAVYGRSFATLADAQRQTLVREAEKAPRSSLENLFFRALRDDLMERYYTRPGVWPSLRFAGPPQPVGFPDFAEPPQA